MTEEKQPKEIPSEREDNIGPDFIKAFIAARAEMPAATKNAVNPHFGNKYSDLESVISVIEGPLERQGLALLTLPVPDPSSVTLEFYLIHDSGQYIKFQIKMTPEKNTPQAFGSTLSYARRYGITTLFNLKTEDDDGNEASKPPPATQQKSSQSHSAPPEYQTNKTLPAETKHKNRAGINEIRLKTKLNDSGVPWGAFLRFMKNTNRIKDETELTEDRCFKIEEKYNQVIEEYNKWSKQ